MNEPSILTIVPPIIAILLAIWKKNALFALAVGLWVTCFLQTDFVFITSVNDTGLYIWSTLASTGNSRIIIYSLLIGSLMALMKSSGGVAAFVEAITCRNAIDTQRKAAIVPTFIGSLIFTDTNLSLLSAGIASQKLFERFKLSREKLAYLIDSTCAPISVLILINGWGAYILGLIEAQNIYNGISVLIDTVPYNFYALIALLLAYFTAISGKTFGPLSKGTSYIATPSSDIDRHQSSDPWETDNRQEANKIGYFFTPLLIMVVMTFGLLWVTGDGDLRKGSGSFAVLWAIITAFLVLSVMVLIDQRLTIRQWLIVSWRGVLDMLPVVSILVISFAFGDAVIDLGTGIYVSSIMTTDVHFVLVAPIIFITAAIMAFSTGSSWSTFAILIPIAIPAAIAIGAPPAFLVAAALGGGVFGDHASPISDTTVVASLASGCDHIQHVKTQLPYALVAAVFSICLYLLVGLWLS